MSRTMRVITLNAWCGRSLYPLMDFLRKEAKRTDIFCLQEVRDSDQKIADKRYPNEYVCGPLFRKISRELWDFDGHFASFENDPHHMSVATFVSIRRTMEVDIVGSTLISTPKEPTTKGSKIFSARKLQYTILNDGLQAVLVANYHGLWNAAPKTDTPERLAQSHRIRMVLDAFSGPKILCGDFNLLPDTESMRILEKGMVNLVKEYNVESTRTLHYRNFYDPKEPNFADYILISPEIMVKKFEVLPDIVSDHAPLALECEL